MIKHLASTAWTDQIISTPLLVFLKVVVQLKMTSTAKRKTEIEEMEHKTAWLDIAKWTEVGD